jgi:RNA polymerase sigma factor (sigma-70 family)
MSKHLTYSNSGNLDISPNNFIEISIDPSLLNNFSNEESMSAYFGNYAFSEEFQKLKTELIQEIMSIIDSCLTKKQKEVIRMTYIEGKTQHEISILLGKHQTSIHKALTGNIDYNNDKKRYGGALKKIRKLCASNKKINEILAKMKEKQEEYKEVE